MRDAFAQAVNASEDLPKMYPLAPMMTIDKYETMQRRRVHATLEFTMNPTWRLWGDQVCEVESILKERHPDLVVQRVIAAVADPNLAQDMALRVEGG
ncbi:MAG: hypothetical protein SGPRY_014674, partial [Prymnesium sp.]